MTGQIAPTPRIRILRPGPANLAFFFLIHDHTHALTLQQLTNLVHRLQPRGSSSNADETNRTGREERLFRDDERGEGTKDAYQEFARGAKGVVDGG
jgi:hypothetical protein